MEYLKKHWKGGVLGILFIADFFIWFTVATEAPGKNLEVAFLNIGQGDAIYIESPTHNQVIVDGGPPHAILKELGKVMPFYDRTIDTLIVTNPDADHFAGFIDVLRSYKVTRVIEPGTHSDSQTYKEFERTVAEQGIEKIIARRGMILDMGAGVTLRILYPDKDVSNLKTNDGSIVSELKYGETEVLLTGDAPSAVEEYVATLEGPNIQADVLKMGHHGSKTSSAEEFISEVHPQYAVISAGVHNKYHHPSPETVDVLHKLGIPILGTYEKGTIILQSNGKEYSFTYK